MEKKIIEAFQMAPAAVELNQSGYLDPQEMMALKEMHMHFRSKCEDLALRYLKAHPSPVAAKNAAMADVRRIQAGTTPDDPDVDLSLYFDVLRTELEGAIARESGKSEWRRNVTRFLLLIPGFFRIAALLFVVVIIAFALWDVIR